MALDSFSSAFSHKSANVGRLAGTKLQRSLRRINASSRWRSEVLANPDQALEAYVNLAMTTDRQRDVVHAVSTQDWHLVIVGHRAITGQISNFTKSLGNTLIKNCYETQMHWNILWSMRTATENWFSEVSLNETKSPVCGAFSASAQRVLSASPDALYVTNATSPRFAKPMVSFSHVYHSLLMLNCQHNTRTATVTSGVEIQDA